MSLPFLEPHRPPRVAGGVVVFSLTVRASDELVQDARLVEVCSPAPGVVDPGEGHDHRFAAEFVASRAKGYGEEFRDLYAQAARNRGET